MFFNFLHNFANFSEPCYSSEIPSDNNVKKEICSNFNLRYTV